MGTFRLGFALLVLLTILAGAAISGERPGWAGVDVEPVPPEFANMLGLAPNQGAVVTHVTGQGPADRAGLQPGDVILRVDGLLLKDAEAFAELVSSRPAGTSLALTVWRGSREVPLTLQLQDRRAGAPRTQPVADLDAGPAPGFTPIAESEPAGATADSQPPGPDSGELVATPIPDSDPLETTKSATTAGLGIAFVPVTDANQKDLALQYGYKMMGERHEVDRVYAASAPEDIWRALESLRREGQMVRFILMVGHSSGDLPRVDLAKSHLYKENVDLMEMRQDLALHMTGWFKNLERGNAPEAALKKIPDIVQQIERLQAVSEVCLPGAHVVLWACSNAKTEVGRKFCRNLGNVLAGRYGGRLMASRTDIRQSELTGIGGVWPWMTTPGAEWGDFAVQADPVLFDIPSRGPDYLFEIGQASSRRGRQRDEIEIHLPVRQEEGPGPVSLAATFTAVPSRASATAGTTLPGPGSQGVIVARLRNVKHGDVCYYMVRGTESGPRVGRVSLSVNQVRTIEIPATPGANSISTDAGAPTRGFGQSEDSDVWIPFNFQIPGGVVRRARIVCDVRPLGGLTNTDAFYLKAPSMSKAATVWSGFNGLPDKQWSTVTFEVTDPEVLKAIELGGLLEGLVQDDSNVDHVKLLLDVED